MRRSIPLLLAVLSAFACQSHAIAEVEEIDPARAPYSQLIALRAASITIRNLGTTPLYFVLNSTDVLTRLDWSPCVSAQCPSIPAGDSLVVPNDPAWTAGLSMELHLWRATRDGRRLDARTLTAWRFRR